MELTLADSVPGNDGFRVVRLFFGPMGRVALQVGNGWSNFVDQLRNFARFRKREKLKSGIAVA